MLLLVAVAAFAALAYAVSSGTRGSSTVLDSERARLTASDIVGYGDSLRPVLARQTLSGEAGDLDAPALELLPPPPEACLAACAYALTGQFTMAGAGTEAPELSLVLVDVPRRVCEMANTVSGVPGPVPEAAALTETVPFAGTNYGAAPAVTLPAAAARSLCYRESDGARRYIYVNVLHAR